MLVLNLFVCSSVLCQATMSMGYLDLLQLRQFLLEDLRLSIIASLRSILPLFRQQSGNHLTKLSQLHQEHRHTILR